METEAAPAEKPHPRVDDVMTDGTCQITEFDRRATDHDVVLTTDESKTSRTSVIETDSTSAEVTAMTDSGDDPTKEMADNLCESDKSDRLMTAVTDSKEDSDDADMSESGDDRLKDGVADGGCHHQEQLQQHKFKVEKVVSHRFEGGGNFGRGCKWSPDGLCVLTCNNDRKLRIFDMPPHQLQAATASEATEEKEAEEDSLTNKGCPKEKKGWDPVLTMRECGTIYDFQWYPLMNSSLPETCFLAVTSQHQPIHLYDAYDATLKATFRVYDHADEVTPASCLAFDPQGQRLYAGLKNQVRVFEVAAPGRDCITRKTFTKRDGGVSGIVSAIAFNPAMPQVYAVGSYGKDLGVYLEPDPHTLCYLEGAKGGITHLQFSPDGTKLCAGARKPDGEILVWDMRNPGQLYACAKREVATNQRIYFDVKSNLLGSGSTDGTVRIWDLNSIEDEGNASMPFTLKRVHLDDDTHSDCVNGFSFHPFSPYFATSTGQRHLKSYSDLSSDSDEQADNQDAKSHEQAKSKNTKSRTEDNSLNVFRLT